MKAYLVTNSFLRSPKFVEIYEILSANARKFNIDLIAKTTTDLMSEIHSVQNTIEAPDFVLYWDKDIMLARQLEMAGIKLFNSAKAIECCDNKEFTSLALLQAGIKQPRTIFAPKTFENIGYTNVDFYYKAKEILGLPMVIKEAYGSFGWQVYLANTDDEAIEIINKVHNKDFLMQELVKSSYGKDIRINVVGDKVISAMLRYNPNDFRSNISNGGSMKAYSPSKEQCELAIMAAHAVGADFAGVDVLFGENNEPIICEVNSNPHFKSSIDCTGIDVAYHIFEYITGLL
ncbi:MAG: RimK family alpha-L-glutamate ligase [Lachnospiraceae bacterium]|nr:RimK family alpha-L-glutamate ligase [Lachnospiraceae bacterium]